MLGFGRDFCSDGRGLRSGRVITVGGPWTVFTESWINALWSSVRFPMTLSCFSSVASHKCF